MSTLKKLPGTDLAKEFDQVLVKSWARVPRKKNGAGEVALCKGIITKLTIDELNQAAAKSLDTSANAINFYGGLIHGTPYAHFEAESTMQGFENRTCELGDLLVLLVRSDVVITLGQVAKISSVSVEKRACFIQAKLSDVKSGSRVCNFTPKGPILPQKGEEETQLYLYNQWPEFTLSGGVGPYDLTSLNPCPQSACKYGHVLTDVDEKQNLPDWNSPHRHVWKQAEPVPNVSGVRSLGAFLLDMAELTSGAGASYSPRNLQKNHDWPDLIDELTKRCSLKKWNGCREANPATIDVQSWLSWHDIAHVALSDWNPVVPIDDDIIEFIMSYGVNRRSQRSARRLQRKNSGKGMPVLIVCVSSRRQAEEEYGAAPNEEVTSMRINR